MSGPPPLAAERRAEAERLIELARGMLDRSDEKMVVIYLNHAIETLHMIGEDQRSLPHHRSSTPVSCPPKVQAQDRG